MNIPSDLKYTKTDEWVKVEGKTATIGISDYAQDQLSDVVFVEIPVDVGSKVAKGEIIATVESVKAAADVNMPVSGKVISTNDNLPQTPETVNSDPYGKAWMIKVELENPVEVEALMSANDYDAYCKERSH